MENEKYDGCYDRLFARFYDRFMDRTEKVVLARRRKRLLSGLTGRILEIGSGTGINFPLYGKGAQVIAAEPSKSMMEKALGRKTDAQKIHEETGNHAMIDLVTAGIGDARLDEMIEPSSLDAVVCTLVLCTVPDLNHTVEFARSKLKPGGRFIVLEHVVAKSLPGRILQNLLNPVWKIFARGCNLNRDPEKAIKAAGFVLLEEEHFRRSMPFYRAVFAMRTGSAGDSI